MKTSLSAPHVEYPYYKLFKSALPLLAYVLLLFALRNSSMSLLAGRPYANDYLEELTMASAVTDESTTGLKMVHHKHPIPIYHRAMHSIRHYARKARDCIFGPNEPPMTMEQGIAKARARRAADPEGLSFFPRGMTREQIAASREDGRRRWEAKLQKDAERRAQREVEQAESTRKYEERLRAREAAGEVELEYHECGLLQISKILKKDESFREREECQTRPEVWFVPRAQEGVVVGTKYPVGMRPRLVRQDDVKVWEGVLRVEGQ
ncbi:hypothetical protein BDV95DRAFT_602320 [Massariosphaeria phaeospora]|uniref:Uncharacterized protein n=1 Tax=Massariosphaeria phaeospora TaxID=100035 RepID=A0A7C8MT46_9PLEO|nr:hypothetical protein BDV95DRAFT_602320 [Massariosphaeria phaeospora]